MTPEITSLLVQSSGAATVTGMFLWYLVKLNKKDDDRQLQFNTIIREYLCENSKAQILLATKLQEFSDVSREHKIMLEKLYVELLSKSSKIKKYESEGEYKHKS